MELDQLWVLDERMWRHKSGVILLQRGDKNTAYFPKIASCRRISNVDTTGVVGISKDASVFNLKTLVTVTFNDRFALCNSIHMEKWEARFPCLHNEEVDHIEVPFLKERDQAGANERRWL